MGNPPRIPEQFITKNNGRRMADGTIAVNHVGNGNFIGVDVDDLYPELLEGKMNQNSSEALDTSTARNLIVAAKFASMEEKSNATKMRSEQKKHGRKKLRIVLIVLSLIVILSAPIISHIASAPSISGDDKKNIDDKISYSYSEVNGLFGGYISMARNDENMSKLNKLRDVLISAANTSELEFRCTLLGTAKVLGCTPFCRYMDIILNPLYGEMNNYPNATSLLFAGNTENLLRALGYTGDNISELWDDYWENERKNIYNLFMEKEGLTPVEAEALTAVVEQEGVDNYQGTGSRGGK